MTLDKIQRETFLNLRDKLEAQVAELHQKAHQAREDAVRLDRIADIIKLCAMKLEDNI
jgi:hypothetical protein